MIQIPARQGKIVIQLTEDGIDTTFAYEGFNTREEAIRWLSRNAIQPSRISRTNPMFLRFAKGAISGIEKVTRPSEEFVKQKHSKKEKQE